MENKCISDGLRVRAHRCARRYRSRCRRRSRRHGRRSFGGERAPHERGKHGAHGCARDSRNSSARRDKLKPPGHEHADDDHGKPSARDRAYAQHPDNGIAFCFAARHGNGEYPDGDFESDIVDIVRDAGRYRSAGAGFAPCIGCT
jgi:hypothetical protein